MDDLDNLQGVAAAADSNAAELDGQNQAPGTEVAVIEQGPDYMTEARGMVDLFAAMAVGYAPKAESVWTEQAKARTAAALVPVMEKYAFSMGAMPPELTLIIVAGPMLWQTSKIVAAQMAEEKAKAKPKEKDKPADGQGISEVMAKPTGQPEQGPATPTHPQMALYK